LAILTCPGCGRGSLRVPDGRRGKVTCPSCGAEWFHPETIQVRDVEFRCAQSGAGFVVQLSRRSPLHKFVIQAIKNAIPRKPAPDLTVACKGDTSEVSQASALLLPGPNAVERITAAVALDDGPNAKHPRSLMSPQDVAALIAALEALGLLKLAAT